VPQSLGPPIAVKDYQAALRLLRCCDVREKILAFLQRALADWSLGQHILTDLHALTRINSFDGLARNAFILQIPVELMETDDGLSPFSLHGPQTLEAVPDFPPHLSPTALQRSVRHHPWLDLFSRAQDEGQHPQGHTDGAARRG
jgi:hypothetical protein